MGGTAWCIRGGSRRDWYGYFGYRRGHSAATNETGGVARGVFVGGARLKYSACLRRRVAANKWAAGKIALTCDGDIGVMFGVARGVCLA